MNEPYLMLAHSYQIGTDSWGKGPVWSEIGHLKD